MKSGKRQSGRERLSPWPRSKPEPSRLRQCCCAGACRRWRTPTPCVPRPGPAWPALGWLVLLALTDGVVAIALTLLVLQLQVPVSDTLKANPDSARALWHALDPDGIFNPGKSVSAIAGN